jgi:apolipoprotein N-acyltransferase
VLFPQIVADRRDEQSVAIVNLADDSWVAGEVVDAQLIAAASFRAIEQRLTLVRVSHGGLSVVINRFGESIASLEPDTLAHLFVDVAAAPRPSTFEKSAMLCPPILVGLVMWILFPGICRRLDRT